MEEAVDSRVDLTAHNRLQPHHRTSSHNNRIDQPMRHRSMPTTAMQRDPHAISSTHKQPPASPNNARPMRHNMGSQHNIRHRDPVARRLIKAIVDHRLRARPALLGGLENQHQRARPALARRVQGFRGSQQARDVHVVAAGVHHGLLDAVGVGHAFLAGVRQAGAFFDREGVEIGAQQDGWAGAIAEDGRDAVAANVGFDVEVAGDALELGDAAGGGFFFLVGELWVGVEVLIEVLVFAEFRTVLGGDFRDVRHVGGHLLPDINVGGWIGG